MTNFNNTLIRCHALGHIMCDPRGKTNQEKYNDAVEALRVEREKLDAMPKQDGKMAENKRIKIAELEKQVGELELVKDQILLSESCKTYLIQSYVLSKYGRVREITTKQMMKGTFTEENAIDLFSVMDGVIYNKNTHTIKNDFIAGTPDLHDGDDILNCFEVIDIKSCWDIFTFLSNVADPHNDMYYWQIQGYMALTGAKIGTIAYCLVNTPESIIEGEKYNLLRKLDVATEEAPEYKREVEKLLQNRRFDDIPMEERVLTYSVERNDADIERIYQKVVKCREFIAEFEEMHLKFSKNYRKTLYVGV